MHSFRFALHHVAICVVLLCVVLSCRKTPVVKEQTTQLARLIEAFAPKRGSGIVYCLSRADTERIASEMSLLGVSCAPYHAYLDAGVLRRTHEHWLAGVIQVRQECGEGVATACWPLPWLTCEPWHPLVVLFVAGLPALS